MDVGREPEVVGLRDPSLPVRTSYWEEGGLKGSADQRPMLIVLHGLSGGSYEIYLR